MYKTLSALGIGLLLLTACSNDEPAPTASPSPADILITNGTVYTVNKAQPRAEAVAIAGNQIVFVGSAEEAEAFIDGDTRIIDVDGGMVLPGFVSGHDHLVASDWLSYGVSLYDGTSKEEYLQLIADYAEANPDERVIRGIGWQPAFYGGMPTKEELDAIVPDRPAILMDFTIHDAWLNSKALEIGGIDKETEDPVPGVTYWNRDAEGNPSGTAIEFAWMPTYIAVGAWDPAVMVPASAEKNLTAAAAAGMTTFLNPALVTPNVNNTDGMFEDYATIMAMLGEWEAEGALPLRAFIQPAAKSPDIDPVDFAKRSAEFARRYDSDTLRSFGVKIHPEGNWSSLTSVQLEPYEGTSDNHGAAGIDADLIKAIVLAANAQGLDVFTHVDGSATVRGKIDAIAASRAAGNDDERNALHHFFWVHPDDLQRTLAMDIPVNVTPNFSTDWTGQDIQAIKLLGDERIAQQYAQYPAVAANGNKLSISADIPSSPLELIGPLFNIEAAVTLQDPTNPDSKPFPPGRKPLTLKQAIEAVTLAPAWQIRMEDKIGSIEAGKYADIVILEQDLFEVEPRDIADVKVLGTMMNGQFTYRSGL